MKRGYQESSSSGSLRPPQSKIRHNPEGDAHFLEDESTKVFARKVADHYSARMNQTLEEQGASPIIHLKKLNNCIESVLIQLYAHRGDAVLDLACGKVAEKMGLIEQYREERERQQKLAKEEEIRRLRKELIPRAQPMPYFDRPFIPRRSMKHCTIPREPKFHKPPQHKKIKCGMICSHTNSEMQRRKKNQDFS